MELVKNLAVEIWEKTAVLAIQTSWELSEPPCILNDIENGAAPICEPFCIIPRDLVNSSWGIDGEPIGKNGILLDNRDNWNNVFCDVDEWVEVN